MSDPHVQLMDDARHEEAVAERTRQRHIAEADGQDASLAGSLRALGAAAATVIVETTVGRSLRGRVGQVSHDHVTIVDPAACSFVRLDQVTALRAVGGGPTVVATPAEGPSTPADARPTTDVGAALLELVHERVAVDVHLVGGATVRGALRGVGADVLTVEAGGARGVELVHLPLAAVVSVPAGSV